MAPPRNPGHHPRPPRPVSLVLRRIGLGMLLLGGVAFAVWSLKGSSAIEAINAQEPSWNPKPKPQDEKAPPAPVTSPTEPDIKEAQIKALLAEQQRMQRQAEQDRLAQQKFQQEMLAALAEAQKQKQTQTAQTGPAKPPRPHRSLASTASYFELPKEPVVTEALYELTAGHTILPCHMKTKTVSDVESTFLVEITNWVYDSGSFGVPLIPPGSVLMGHYSSRLIYGNQRLPMFSTKLVIRGREPIELEDTALMTGEGTAGLVSDIDNHYGRALAAVLIRSVLEGSQYAIMQAASGGADQILVSGTRNMSQMGTTYTQPPYIDLRPTITVNPGEDCVAILQKTLKLPVYAAKE